MFKRVKGDCESCGKTNVWLARKKPPMCIYCKSKAKAKYKKTAKRKATGEAAVFLEIWNERERVSFVDGRPLPTQEPYSYYFSHILKKGSFPGFRLYKKNIVFMTLEEHNEWELNQWKIKDDPKWAHVFKLKQELINEYNIWKQQQREQHRTDSDDLSSGRRDPMHDASE